MNEYKDVDKATDWIYDKEIKFPLEISEVTVNLLKTDLFSAFNPKVGSFVAVRPIDDEKTYLGVFIGSFITGDCYNAYNKNTKQFKLMSGNPNPVIFIPDLNKVVWGYESWWAEIVNENELREITNGDIENLWYIKALKFLKDNKNV